jgi:fucose 4-O-acetylase-like acetyltransferase
MMSADGRMTHFDIAKGIAFIGVVWGHFLSPYGTVIIYTFNLPLFFVVSGYFLNRNKKWKLIEL